MTLLLRLEDPFAGGGGAVGELSLERRGAIIGRSPAVDWSLPDPEKIVSSRHCEIDYRGGAYLLVDTSTNGTLVNDQRLSGPHVLANGDVVTIGRYRARVALDAPLPEAALPAAGWGGWGAHESATPPGGDPTGWDRPAPAAEISGRGALSGQWAAPSVSDPAAAGWGAAPTGPASSAWGEPPAAAAAPGWDTPPTPAPSEPARWGSWAEPSPPVEAASGWSSAAAPPLPASGEDIWGKIAASNVVDWARGGFGAAPAPPPPVSSTLGLAPPPESPSLAGSRLQSPPPPPATPNPGPPSRAGALSALIEAAGLQRADFADDVELARATGGLLRRLIAGLVVMVEARARAKAQMGAAGTSLQFEGNNPLKFARTPEGALKQLLRPAERGFMPAERAVEDAFVDLQAHQIATLKAMQGALRATLDRFSPAAIRKRAEGKGLLRRILPAARDAALWHAYEREFSGVAQGSDEAFMDVFAKEFRRAYEEAGRGGAHARGP